MQPGAQAALTLHYQQNKWLAIDEDPSSETLIRIALTRIEHDPKQYDLFVAMLRSITGMGFIADKITSGESDL